MNKNKQRLIKTTLNKLLDQCRSIISERPDIVSWEKKAPSGEKSIVTSVDIKIENILYTGLLNEYPNASIISEESYLDANVLNVGLCFVIDPIDGTKEFIAGSSRYAISIAVYQKGIAEMGVLDFPSQELRFWSTRGEGSFKDDSPICVSGEDCIEKLRIGVSPTQARSPYFAFYKEKLKGASLIPIGSLSSKVTEVACGNIDAAFYLDGPGQTFALWDFASCKLILEEAGGKFTGLNGEDILPSPNIWKNTGWLATNGLCHQALEEIFKGISLEKESSN